MSSRLYSQSADTVGVTVGSLGSTYTYYCSIKDTSKTHYRGENGRKFVKVPSNKKTKCTKLQASNQTCTKIAHKISVKKSPSHVGDTVDSHAPGYARTNVRITQNHARTNARREHQARTHVRISEKSTKRTVHIHQWGSHPLSLAGWQGPAKRK